ncbi:hypothetical protein BSNK01_05720 [Bacillaceae bacterium]
MGKISYGSDYDDHSYSCKKPGYYKPYGTYGEPYKYMMKYHYHMSKCKYYEMMCHQHKHGKKHKKYYEKYMYHGEKAKYYYKKCYMMPSYLPKMEKPGYYGPYSYEDSYRST